MLPPTGGAPRKATVSALPMVNPGPSMSSWSAAFATTHLCPGLVTSETLKRPALIQATDVLYCMQLSLVGLTPRWASDLTTDLGKVAGPESTKE